MKLHLTSILFASSLALGAGQSLYTGNDIDGVNDTDKAATFCAAKGQILANEAEWCAYAGANNRIAYGTTAIKDKGCDNVETTCFGPIQRTRGAARRLEQCASQQYILCVPDPTPRQAPPRSKSGGSGDPHFKTWTGEKFDYHGECDLVLVDHPTFANGLGLKLHIRTTRVTYFSYIEKMALQIGNDVIEFDNDVENFLINGSPVEANHRHHKTMLNEYVVRRDKKAISVRLAKDSKAKIDFHTRKNGFPAVIVDGADTDIFKGSLGLLGDWESGKKLARDGETELNDEDATAFALEWQVRDTEPMLFKDARFPQYPHVCTPPKKMLDSRLGMLLAKEQAEAACAHWEEDKEDCIFDVIATRNVIVAEEGHIVDVE